MDTTERSEITHEPDPITGHYRQLVSPARLRAILDAEGSDYTRPEDFTPEDEWVVAAPVVR
jgi:hypothetical protein